jgi:hypothetical protein
MPAFRRMFYLAAIMLLTEEDVKKVVNAVFGCRDTACRTL